MPLQLVLRDEQSLFLPLVSFSLFSGVIKVFDGTTILILKVIMFQMEIATDLVLASNFLLVGFFLFLRPKISFGWICSPSVFLCSSWPVREKPHSVGKHQASLDLTVLKSQAEISHGVYTLSPQAFQPFNISISSLPYTFSTSPTLTKASYSAHDAWRKGELPLFSWYLISSNLSSAPNSGGRKRHLTLSAETYKGLYFSGTWVPFWYTVFYQ